MWPQRCPIVHCIDACIRGAGFDDAFIIEACTHDACIYYASIYYAFIYDGNFLVTQQQQLGCMRDAFQTKKGKT